MSGNLVVDWVNNVLSVAEKCYDSVNVAKRMKHLWRYSE